MVWLFQDAIQLCLAPSRLTAIIRMGKPRSVESRALFLASSRSEKLACTGFLHYTVAIVIAQLLLFAWKG